MCDLRYLGFFFSLSLLSLNFVVGYLFYAPEWYNYIYIMPYVCALITNFTSPGVVTSKIVRPEKPTKQQEDFIDVFSGHDYVKPPHAHYSKVTQRMILGYDHYCVWVAQDIGLMNYRFFIQFVGWTILSLTLSLERIFPILFGCFYSREYYDCNILYRYGWIIYPLWLVACLFFVFTFGLFVGAMNTLHRGMSDVDVMKGHYIEKGNTKDSFTIYYGNSIPIIYHLFPWPNSKRIRKRRDRLESVCSKYFEDNGVKVVYK